MNKTININIGGRIFNVEETAYRTLDNYLRSLKAYFSTRESGDEILMDIEARIAELFDARTTPAKQVITEKDVEEVIGIMGRPEDYMDAEEDNDSGPYEHRGEGRHRRVYRDPDDKVLFGVCSGISAYLGWDPLILRAFFVIALLFFGFGPLLYIILAIIIPKAVTTAEKLRMRGEPVNVDNISKKVSESFKGFKDDVNDFSKRHKGKADSAQGFGRRLGELFEDLIEGLGKALRALWNALSKILGVLFLIAGIAGICALLAAAFGLDGAMVFSHNGTDLESQLGIWTGAIFTSPGQQKLFFWGAVLVLVVPLVGLLLAGVRMLFDYRGYYGMAAVVLLVAFFVGTGFLVAVGINLSREFMVETTLNERLLPSSPGADTLVIDIVQPPLASKSWSLNFDDGRIFWSGSVTFPGTNSTDILYCGQTRFTIDEWPRGKDYRLRTARTARGRSQKNAMSNAEKILGIEQFTSDTLRVYPYYAVKKGTKFRDQELEYILNVPLGKTVYFAPDSRQVIYDVPNITNTLDRNMIGHHWRMTERGLDCTDCPPEYDRRRQDR